MSRYIDAEGLFNWGKHKLADAVKYGNKDADQQHWSYSTLMMHEVADEINDAPTADVAPVVRCVECMHYKAYGDWSRMRQEEVAAHECEILRQDMGETGFCAYGARMDLEVEA